jgi:tRNA(Arg) A34 adenosine deaminase TadA
MSKMNNGKDQHEYFMAKAIEMASQALEGDNGGPFGAVIVKNGKIVGKGRNRVTSKQDPTAHAEIEAIRDACCNLGEYQLDGCTIYSSCEPCPMCLGAIYWARTSNIYYACSREDAANAEFDDAFIYEEIGKSPQSRTIASTQIMRQEAFQIFTEWIKKQDKRKY